ncbi:MAG: type II toxin-antitoxin system RelE/ParE family toxin [Methylotenera sp.]|nr:type II toxin-antitoxin system RelE/ParE family toxin [Flavobacterium sp.]
MEKKAREVVQSASSIADISDIYDYGLDTFGQQVAETLLFELYQNIAGLSVKYLIYPECKHMATKTQIYRNIIVGKYLTIYRITSKRIEVLRVIHGSIAPTLIKRTKSVKL